MHIIQDLYIVGIFKFALKCTLNWGHLAEAYRLQMKGESLSLQNPLRHRF